MTPRWQLTSAVTSWLVAAGVFLLVGLVSGRPDVAVLGVPLLLAVGWSSLRRPDAAPEATLRAGDQSTADGRLVGQVDVEPGTGAQLLHLRVGAPGHRPVEALVLARRRSIAVAMRTVRTGRRQIFRLDYRSSSGDQLLTTPARAQTSVMITVLPGARRLPAVPLPFRLTGSTGPHGSRRAGEGGDLRDIALFQPGDRLRRIDWRVTSRLNAGGPRSTDLYVRRAFATAEATVILVIDSRDEVGPRVATWEDAAELREDEATSLDLARHAAASVARFCLEAGDRVGLEDLGRIRRPSPPAGGRSQLPRLVQRLAVARPEGEPAPRKRMPRLPSGSLIVLLSTFLDETSALMARGWRAAGHRVIAIDTLPCVIRDGLSSPQLLAYRIVAMEREDRLLGLQGVGVETVRWDGSAAGADPALELGALARQRRRR